MRCAALVFLLASGCSMTPTVAPPTAERSLPAAFEQATAEPPPAPGWWTDYRDAVLDAVVDSALSRNRNLAAATARVAELQAQYRIARGQRLPAVIAGADASRTDTPSNTGFSRNIGASFPEFPDRFTNENYSITGTLAYELDLWGRVRSEKDAALALFQATEQDFRAAEMGVISEAVATYFELCTLEKQLSLSRENASLLQERLELTEDRFARGIAPSFEVYAIRQEYEGAQSSIPLLEAGLADARGRLGVVLGMYPADIRALLDGGTRHAADPAHIPGGIPADVIGQRPDVAAALLRVEAALQGVGAARARLLPTLSLTASGGLQSAELSELLDVGQNFSNLIASLTAPLFQGGALRAGVDASQARLDAAVAAYEQTLFTAFKEVEVTLIAHAKQRERLAFLNEESVAARAGLRTAEERFRRGVGDYLSLLDARRNLIRVETALETATRDVALARLAVYRALGGSWTNPQTES